MSKQIDIKTLRMLRAFATALVFAAKCLTRSGRPVRVSMPGDLS